MEETDRGELADILIDGTEGFISIEAKYKTDYDYQKDIVENQNRIKKAREKFNCSGIQVLLISKSKWINSQNKINNPASNYKKLLDHIKKHCETVPFILLEWQDVLDILIKSNISDKVSRLLAKMLNLNTNWRETNSCPFSEERLSLFEYNPDDDEDKIYNTSWCNAIGDICDCEDPSLCGTRKWRENI